MSAAGASRNKEVVSFRTRLFTAIMIIVVSFNLLGDGIRDALDPKAAR